MRENLQQRLNNTDNEKIFDPPGLPLPRGYIHVYEHHFQTSSPLKPLGQSKPNFMEPPWEGGTKVCN